jgi:hypothetical protein
LVCKAGGIILFFPADAFPKQHYQDCSITAKILNSKLPPKVGFSADKFRLIKSRFKINLAANIRSETSFFDRPFWLRRIYVQKLA